MEVQLAVWLPCLSVGGGGVEQGLAGGRDAAAARVGGVPGDDRELRHLETEGGR